MTLPTGFLKRHLDPLPIEVVLTEYDAW